MWEKFQNILDQYLHNELSLESYVLNFKLLHREKTVIETEPLKKELHPKLQEILPDLIKKVEKKTNLVYSGIFDGLENYETELHHYHVQFQHIYGFRVTIDLSFGQGGSCGDKHYVDDDGKIHIGVTTGMCNAVWGEYNIDDKNLLKNLLSSIVHFNEEYGQIY